jgi:hypothetical protein
LFVCMYSVRVLDSVLDSHHPASVFRHRTDDNSRIPIIII